MGSKIGQIAAQKQGLTSLFSKSLVSLSRLCRRGPTSILGLNLEEFNKFHKLGNMQKANEAPGEAPPLVSVIVLNYNGATWLPRCLESLRAQTAFPQIEVIVADNASPDHSDQLATELMKSWPKKLVVQHGSNLGFCAGNNRAATLAKGKYLFFLNNDTWLEPLCLEKLVATVQIMGAQAGTPLMLNYEDDTIQSSGGAGFDVFGLMSLERPHASAREIFVAGGCSYLVLRVAFERLGGFDATFFMYADEYDLSWRLWLSGGVIVSVPDARLHHRGAASVNPAGGEKATELRTSDTKRFYTNRNGLLLLLKNCQNILLVLVLLQLLLLALEASVSLVLVRRWSFVRRAYLEAVLSCWKLRSHVISERKRNSALRQRNDWQMFRFFRLRLNRWEELKNLRRLGLPKVSSA